MNLCAAERASPMSAFAAYGSLDDLITDTLADFALCGIDSSVKLSLLEFAWSGPFSCETADQYALALGRSASPESIRVHLEQLVTLGLLIRDSEAALPSSRYRLTDSPLHLMTLGRLRELLSDPALRSRAAAQLRYRLA